MNYPSGKEVRVGDLIWWDEGHCVGYVQEIGVSKEEYQDRGMDEPYAVFSNIHPYDQNAWGIGHGESCFEDEGIGTLTEEEKSRLDEALNQGKQQSKIGFDDKHYSVHLEVENGEKVGWLFTLRDGDTDLEKITVPYAK